MGLFGRPDDEVLALMQKIIKNTLKMQRMGPNKHEEYAWKKLKNIYDAMYLRVRD